MATNHLHVHRMRNELRERLCRAHVSADRHMYANDINGPDDRLDIGPGLALDFGSPANKFGEVMWNDNSDTWDISIGDKPVHLAHSVDDAYAHCVAAGKERARTL